MKSEDIEKSIEILEDVNEHYDDALAEVNGLKKAKHRKKRVNKEVVHNCGGGDTWAYTPSGTGSFIYVEALHGFVTGEINWMKDSFAALLLNAKYAPDKVNHKYLSDVEKYEVKATGYKRLKIDGRKEWMLTPNGVEARIHGYNAWGEMAFIGSGIKDGFAYTVSYQDKGDSSTSRLVACSAMGKTFDHVCGVTMPDPMYQISV
jgi:hypothetical protein